MNKNTNTLNKLFILTCLILVNLTLFSCSNPTKLTCNQVENIITDLSVKIKPALTSENVAEIEAIAEEFEQTSKKLLTIKTDDDFLHQSTQNLASVYQEYSYTTRKFLRAFTTKNTEDAIASKANLKQLFERQQQLITEMTNYCQSGRN